MATTARVIAGFAVLALIVSVLRHRVSGLAVAFLIVSLTTLAIAETVRVLHKRHQAQKRGALQRAPKKKTRPTM